MNILSNDHSQALRNADAITCGKFCIVRDSSITKNLGIAVRAGEASLVEETMIAENFGGIEMLQGGMVLGNLITRSGSIRGDADNPNVGYGNNVIIHSSPPVGVLPLTPNACAGGC